LQPDFVGSTQLVIKNCARLFDGEQLLEEAYPTELEQFKWRLHAEYKTGIVSIFLKGNPPDHFKGDYVIKYK
jgi:hypothetical protein